MKYYRYVILLCCFSGTLFAQQEFPIYAFHVKDSTWFERTGRDNLGFLK